MEDLHARMSASPCTACFLVIPVRSSLAHILFVCARGQVELAMEALLARMSALLCTACFLVISVRPYLLSVSPLRQWPPSAISNIANASFNHMSHHMRVAVYLMVACNPEDCGRSNATT